MSLTSRTAVRLLMQLASTDTSKDSLIDSLINTADIVIKSWCGRSIESTGSITEYLDGTNTSQVRLRETPVTVSGITAVYYDPSGYYGQAPNAFGSSSLLTAGVDYFLRVDQTDGVTSHCGILERLGGTWAGSIGRPNGRLSAMVAPGRGNIKVQYSGGYSSVPAQVATAAELIVSRIIQMGPQGFKLTSESYAGYSYGMSPPSWANMLMTPEIVGLLLPYKPLRP